MSRFFITDKDNVSPGNITIAGEEVNHIKNVLRCKKGDILVLCDGNGTDFKVRIDSIKQGQIVTTVVDVSKNFMEPPIDITLFQGIPKGDKMEFIIQKTVELGVKKIVPVVTERTVLKLDCKEDREKKRTRWQKISLEAAKQCDRGIVPEIEVPISFKESLKYFDSFDFTLVPYENEEHKTIKSFIKEIKSGKINIKTAGLFIGPEGGFSEEEVNLAVKSGGTLVTLGPRILRTETAGLVVLAILMYELGDMGS